MAYFESLYPSGPALTKQVQRAIKSMDLAKDGNGYFMLNKTKKDLAKENELTSILEKSMAELLNPADYDFVFLSCDEKYHSYYKYSS